MAPSGRRPSKHSRPARPLRSSHSRSVIKADGRWTVRTMAGAASIKEYRCPGCDQLIPIGTPHVVVWPADPGLGFESGTEQRRHWHTSCWERRR